VTTLVLGCGADTRIPGAVHLDRFPFSDIQVTYDLNIAPWPFCSDSFDRIVAHDIIEHIDNAVQFVEECHRLLVAGGKLEVRTACWLARQSYTDPTHRHWFNEESFDFFVPDTFWSKKYWWYSKARFQKESFAHVSDSEIAWVLVAIKEVAA